MPPLLENGAPLPGWMAWWAEHGQNFIPILLSWPGAFVLCINFITLHSGLKDRISVYWVGQIVHSGFSVRCYGARFLANLTRLSDSRARSLFNSILPINCKVTFNPVFLTINTLLFLLYTMQVGWVTNDTGVPILCYAHCPVSQALFVGVMVKTSEGLAGKS